MEGGWKLSASFPVDSVGEYTLRLTRQVDVTKLKHISTRRSSEYDVVIPQMEVCASVLLRVWLIPDLKAYGDWCKRTVCALLISTIGKTEITQEALLCRLQDFRGDVVIFSR